jgi:16S rRNA (cytosine967-C5)-methyltransferase
MPTESRLRVAQALHSVFGQGSRLADSWDADLSPEDAPFAQALLGLCLRRWGRLQAYIHPRLTDSARGLPLGTQVVLAMGFAQLAWLPGVSDHAAVNEAVDLAADRTLGFPPHKGLVNALLRAGARTRDQVRSDLDALPWSLDRTPFAERVLKEALADPAAGVALDHLWARLQDPPQPCFRAVKPGPLPEGLEPDSRHPGALRLGPGAAFPRPWLATGAGMVQDLSSQALMDFHWDRPVRRIADLCAAPGGKTTSLALRWPEAELLAVEQHPRRARRLEENLRARGVQARIVVAEAAAWLRQSPQAFDLILLDAPCSGSGTLRKHPELVWLGDGLDLERLRTVQESLLGAAVASLAPGGLLIYSVCSWLPEEGREPVHRILDSDAALAPWPAWPVPLATSLSGSYAQDPLTWEGEGFQAFALTRNSTS